LRKEKFSICLGMYDDLSLADDFARSGQSLFERNSLHFAAFQIGNPAPNLLTPSLID